MSRTSKALSVLPVLPDPISDQMLHRGWSMMNFVMTVCQGLGMYNMPKFFPTVFVVVPDKYATGG
jgi:hypothetical protein